MAEKMNILFSPPDITEEEIGEVADALRSGWITTGPRVKELERQLAVYLGVPRCVCLNSQTACAEMALRVLGVGPGDEVIVPAYTYTASASVICHVGATPVMVDCAPDSFEMDYDAMGRAITARTKAVIPVDLGGVPCDYDRIFAVLEEKRSLFNPASPIQEALGRVAVCEDAAHALGSTYHGRMIGSVADFTSFSFHAVKNFTTAEGGCLTWNLPSEVLNDEVYKKVQLLSLHGQSKDALAKTKLGAWEYDVLGPWYKCNMTDIQAALGLVQLKRYKGLLERRRELIGLYDDVLEPLGIESLPHYGDGHASSGHLYICRVPGVLLEERNAIIEKMAERGIATNVHYKPLPLLTAYKDLGFDIGDHPNAYERFANEITLPLHTKLTDDEARYVVAMFAEIVEGVR